VTPSPGGAGTALAAQWNVYRGRLYDALALGRAGQASAGAAVAQSIFAQFENASGEFGAHEALERTSESAYEGFEAELGTLQSALTEGEIEAAADAAASAADTLQVAQQAVAGNEVTRALDLLWFAGRGANARFLADAGAFEAAASVAIGAAEDFEQALVHSVLENASPGDDRKFRRSLRDAGRAAGDHDAVTVADTVGAALTAAVSGAYELVRAEAAGAAHLASMQAQGYDAAALAAMGGPGQEYADATSLAVYRARAYDVGWLSANGATAAASTAASDVFAHFEGASAHEALEAADNDAYEGFERGLESLSTAIEGENDAAVEEAVATVDSTLVTGLSALAGEHAAVLQSGFFRARLGDARELYAVGRSDAAAAITADLFARFEANELGFHESLEHESSELYETFEHDHLPALQRAFADQDDAAVETHYAGVQDALLAFAASQPAALASGAETVYMLARGFDAGALGSLDAAPRAAMVAQAAFEHFESGAAGFHEALEGASHETYESFESKLGDIQSTAANDGDVYQPATAFNTQGLAGMDAIVASAGGENNSLAAELVTDVFATFEGAAVHESLADADQDAYEAFEAALSEYADALESGEVDPAGFAAATRTAQFAVVGASADAPAGAESRADSDQERPSLSGGPDVVEGVPAGADHVVRMEAATYEPAELTIEAGETVAFEFASGEPHTVTAVGNAIPAAAAYWASGGFDSEEAARAGWEAGEGAIKSGQSYVHTFKETGEHEYVCIPHERAGMKGVIIVE
jgi:plastocyanin